MAADRYILIFQKRNYCRISQKLIKYFRIDSPPLIQIIDRL